MSLLEPPSATVDDYLGALAELVAERRKPADSPSDFAIGHNFALRDVDRLIGAAMRVVDEADGLDIEMDRAVAALIAELATVRQSNTAADPS